MNSRTTTVFLRSSKPGRVFKYLIGTITVSELTMHRQIPF